MKKFFGKFLIGLSNILNKVFSFLINGLSFIVNLLSGISVLLIFLGVLLLFVGGIFIPIIIISLIINPIFWIIIFIFFVLPALGKKFISLLRYSNYTLCEYLSNYGNYLVGNNDTRSSFRDFSEKYERMQEEAERKAREERQRMEREAWEARFKEWNAYFNQGQGYSYGYGNYNQSGTNFADPYVDFKNKFEQSCRELEIENYDVDYYEVKLQYRKLAKKYHPDLNRQEDTTAKFQSINSAFEFLTEENIKRYREIKKRM